MTAQAQQTQDDVPAPGSVLADKYRVERVIGRGGMGVVVEARHVALDERVALKFLTAEYATHPEASERFLREARAAVKIKGEHVARVSDVGKLANGSPYMVMELLQGTDLSNALQKYGVCQIPDAIDYVIQASVALAEAHGYGIVHRDIKPANLFLTQQPDGMPLIKVLDFGISKMSGGGVDNLTKTTATMGSALYMSPEQMQASRGVDLRTDIYALGISLYELLAGKQPYYADTLPQLCAEVLTGTPTPLRQVRPDVSPELAVAIEKSYARDRDQRYQSVGEMAVALAPFAPPRSQPALDRVCRLVGLPPVVVGARPLGVSRPPMQSSPMLVGHPGAVSAPSQQHPGAVSAPSQQHPGAVSAPSQQHPGAVSAPSQQHPGAVSAPPGVVAPGHVAVQHMTPQNAILIGGYAGPASQKAAAAFAANTNTSMSSTGMSSSGGRTPVVAIVVGVIALLGIGAGVTAFLMGRGGTASPTDPGPSAPPSTVVAPPTAASSAATGTSTAAEVPSTEPAPSGSASAAPTASATSTSSVTATPTRKHTTTKTGTTTKKPGFVETR